MKNLISIIAIAALLAGCTSQTAYGPCIGVLDDKNPELEYKLSVNNTVMAVLFSSTVFVPILVVANQHSCPVGVKGDTK